MVTCPTEAANSLKLRQATMEGKDALGADGRDMGEAAALAPLIGSSDEVKRGHTTRHKGSSRDIHSYQCARNLGRQTKRHKGFHRIGSCRR